jgi:hypothetical protein
MLFDAIERAYTVVSANFNADFTSLCSLKGVATTGFPAAVIKRETVEIMRRKGQTYPAVGVYAIRATTQMADGGLGGKRDANCAVGADLVIVGTDPVLVQEQIELGCEVLVKALCERIISGAATTYAGGLQKDSVEIDITDAYEEEQGQNYLAIGTVRLPIFDRDNTT